MLTNGRRHLRITTILAAAAFLATAAAMPVSAEVTGTKLGTLDCQVDGGIGLLLGSSKKLQCTFSKADGSTESYSGSINKLGLDVGITGKSFIKWSVYVPEGGEAGANALAGKYSGVSTGLSLGIGLGANALVGGDADNIGLQPIAVEGQTGLNVALAIATLNLEAAQ